MRFLLGVDLGQQSDPTAIVLTEHERSVINPNIADTPEWERRPKKIRNTYTTRMIERHPLGTPYTEVVERVKTIMNIPKIVGETQLIVDATGVGLPVIDMMRQAGLSPVGIWITPGESVSRVDYGYKVPKRDIATALQIVYQSRRIGIVKSLELTPVLVNELQNFRVKIKESTGHDQYEAWRSGQHDDIVLAQGILIWYAEKVFPQGTAWDEHEANVAPDWNPLLI